MSKKILSILILVLTLSFSIEAFASLTFTGDAITGTTASTIDLGVGNNLLLQTSGGNVGIGTTSPNYRISVGNSFVSTYNGANPVLAVTDSGATAAMTFIRYSNNVLPARFILGKSRSASTTMFATVQNLDQLGRIVFVGDDGTDLDTAGAWIDAIVDGTPAGNQIPAALRFWTAADGVGTITERMRITNNGNVGIGTTTPSANLHIVNPSTNAITMVDSYGGAATFIGRTANGTASSPTPVTVSNILAVLGGRGYGSTGFSSLNKGSINIRPGETWTDSAQGTIITFETTQNQTTNRLQKMIITGDGNVGIGTATPGSKLSVVGLPAYANNAAALVGGLVAGDLYYTDTGGEYVVKIAH